MADKFDPYREALIVETTTVWPEGTQLDPRQQAELESLLHESPEEAAQRILLKLENLGLIK